MIPYLQAGNVLSNDPTDVQLEILAAAAPLVQTRMNVLSEAPELLEFLFTPASQITYAEDALKGLPENSAVVVAASVEVLELIPEAEFTHDVIQEALNSALIDGLELKPRIAFGPLRTAISGRRISPPLFESMEILGKQDTIDRLVRFNER
jgi:glutamyl-tRNA synthetase